MKLTYLVIVALQLALVIMLGMLVGVQAKNLSLAEQRFEKAEARAEALQRTRYGWVSSAFVCKRK